MPKVRFRNEAIEVDAAPGASLLEICEKAGVNVVRGIWQEVHCGGNSLIGKAMPRGTCGRCKVWVQGQNGAVSPPTGLEKLHSKVQDMARLACQVRVGGDVEVITKPGWQEHLVAPTTEWRCDPGNETSAWMERWRKAKAGGDEAPADKKPKAEAKAEPAVTAPLETQAASAAPPDAAAPGATSAPAQPSPVPDGAPTATGAPVAAALVTAAPPAAASAPASAPAAPAAAARTVAPAQAAAPARPVPTAPVRVETPVIATPRATTAAAATRPYTATPAPPASTPTAAAAVRARTATPTPPARTVVPPVAPRPVARPGAVAPSRIAMPYPRSTPMRTPAPVAVNASGPAQTSSPASPAGADALKPPTGIPPK